MVVALQTKHTALPCDKKMAANDQSKQKPTNADQGIPTNHKNRWYADSQGLKLVVFDGQKWHAIAYNYL